MANAVSNETLAPGVVVADRYRVESLLGAGAMGVVYLVEHVHMRKRFALKVLSAAVSGNADVVQRFEQEALAAAHVDHPNVAAARDFGRTQSGDFYLVLDYVAGECLRDIVEKGPVPIDRTIAIAKQMCSALAKAHQLGVVHRDLKPENVMIVTDEGGDTVKILDFGIAKVRDVEDALPRSNRIATRAGLVFGTPDYMSPEQALGEAIDGRADLYSLGVMLYEMLTGKPLYETNDPVAMLSRHITAPVPRMAERAPGVVVPGALEAIVRKLLEKVPDDRYTSAAELAEALERRSTASIALHLDRASFADAIASVSGMAATSIRTAVATLDEIPQAAQLRKLRANPRARLALAGVLGALVLVLMSVGLAARSSARRGNAQGETRALASGPESLARARAVTLSDDEIRRAADEGPAALQALAEKHPSNARILRELTLVAASNGPSVASLEAFEKLLALEPEAADDAKLRKVWLDAFESQSPFSATAAAMLERAFGGPGVDLLLERSAQPGANKARIAEWLAKPTVVANALPAAKVVLDLKSARSCEAKHAALERAKEVGDRRALPYIRPLTAGRGCGFLGVSDCWPCLRRDNILRDTLAALEPPKPASTH